MTFRLVSKSVTLTDLERRNGNILRYFTEFGSFRGWGDIAGLRSFNGSTTKRALSPWDCNNQPCEPTRVEIASVVYYQDASKNWVIIRTKELKPSESIISPICQDAPTGEIAFTFGMGSGIITHAKFCDNRFRDFWVLHTPMLPFSIGIYRNSWSP